MLIRSPGASISEIASACGFDDQIHFARMFKRYYSYTPRECRRAGALPSIRI